MLLDFSAGCVGGAAGVIVGHPFDTIKVRLQNQDSSTPRDKRYRGSVDCLFKIIKHETPLGLYKGVSSPLAGLAVINAIVFGVYGNSVRLFADPEALHSHVIAGAFAGITQSFVCSPMELAKLKIQLQGQGVPHYFFWNPREGIYRNPSHCLSEIRRKHGNRAIFKGLSLTLMRDCTGFGLYFAAYDFIARFIHKYHKHVPVKGKPVDANLTVPELLFAGGLAGTTSWLINYPIDLVKTRWQADIVDKTHPVAYYPSIRACISSTYANGGIRGFFAGLAPTLMRAFPSNAVTFLCVSYVYRFFNFVEENRNSREDSLDNAWESLPALRYTQVIADR